MSKILPVNSVRVNSQNDASTLSLQASELRREAAVVARQEFKRELTADEAVVLRDYGPEFLDSQISLDFQAPRSCNTGALIAPTQKIDWLEFTVKGVDVVAACRDYLKISFDLFSVNDFGVHGYPDSAQYGKVWVLWSEQKPERGTKVILSSQALDQVANDAIDIIRGVLADGGTFARIDGAIDDRSGVVSIDTVLTAFRARHDVHRFTQIEPREPVSARTREPVGRSIYWGKPSSSRQICAYDKELERFVKTGEETGPWLRFEARWKKRAANIAAVKLALLGIEALSGMLRGILDFRLCDNDESDRRTPCQWWVDLLGNAQVIRTGISKVVKTIEEKASWLGRQVSKTMGQVAALLDGETILEMIRSGIHATTDKEWKQLDPLGKRVVFSGSGKFEYVTPF